MPGPVDDTKTSVETTSETDEQKPSESETEPPQTEAPEILTPDTPSILGAPGLAGLAWMAAIPGFARGSKSPQTGAPGTLSPGIPRLAGLAWLVGVPGLIGVSDSPGT